jgi:hypothetical protein
MMMTTRSPNRDALIMGVSCDALEDARNRLRGTYLDRLQAPARNYAAMVREGGCRAPK